MGIFVGIFVIALFATAVTVGLRTGSLAPYYPAINRADAPIKFWGILTALAGVVVLNVLNLFWNN